MHPDRMAYYQADYCGLIGVVYQSPVVGANNYSPLRDTPKPTSGEILRHLFSLSVMLNEVKHLVVLRVGDKDEILWSLRSLKMTPV